MDELLFDPGTHRRTSQLLGELLARYEADLTTLPVFPEVDRTALRAILDEPRIEFLRIVVEHPRRGTGSGLVVDPLRQSRGIQKAPATFHGPCSGMSAAKEEGGTIRPSFTL